MMRPRAHSFNSMFAPLALAALAALMLAPVLVARAALNGPAGRPATLRTGPTSEHPALILVNRTAAAGEARMTACMKEYLGQDNRALRPVVVVARRNDVALPAPLCGPLPSDARAWRD